MLPPTFWTPAAHFFDWTIMDTSFTSQDFERMLKYPRTPHLEGSRLQAGDEDSDQVPYSKLKGHYLVIEEKLDGANSGISFNDAGDLLLQSRGHYLAGGGREAQFSTLKRWAAAHESSFLERFEDRYVVYGETMSKLHSVPYDHLPHIFLEFDIWDRAQNAFLSTKRRRELLSGLPIVSVPVLYEGVAPARLRDVLALVRPSLAKSTDWRAGFELNASRAGVSAEGAWKIADPSDKSEGLYIKVETDEHTVGRLKWVRHDFVQAILEGGKHHSEQPYIANSLRPGVDIYAPFLTATW